MHMVVSTSRTFRETINLLNELTDHPQDLGSESGILKKRLPVPGAEENVEPDPGTVTEAFVFLWKNFKLCNVETVEFWW
jgi:hypothetical protein